MVLVGCCLVASSFGCLGLFWLFSCLNGYLVVSLWLQTFHPFPDFGVAKFLRRMPQMMPASCCRRQQNDWRRGKSLGGEWGGVGFFRRKSSGPCGNFKKKKITLSHTVILKKEMIVDCRYSLFLSRKHVWCLPTIALLERVQATATGHGSARNSAVARIPEEITSSIQGQLREAIDSTLMASRDSFLPYI